MARFSVFTLFLLLSFAAFLLASDPSLIKGDHRAAGVFMFIEGRRYTFNFTAARAACLFLNVTIATTAQMERALQHGLETCKFGWIAEQVAVIPRLKSDKKCGQGKTGLVTWAASADKVFGVFCFDASGIETLNRSTASPQSSTIPTALTALTQASTPATPLLSSTTKPPPSAQLETTEVPEQTPLTSAFTLQVKTTHSTSVSSTSATPKPLSTHIPTSPLSHLITSRPTVITFAFSTSAHPSSFSVSSESVTSTRASPAKPSSGDVRTALIILGIILPLLTAAGAVWYYKLNIFTFLTQGQQKDDIETEMWKHTGSEMDLHSQHEGEEEESDRKYSSDITLCVKIISAE
ncbi:lymphatic vessel endothelial hyaluronic receptor 1b [Pempheris klunzingeri]|uniref:lymphatic vessel endothelial hyaluronic receptor 1b n=1 Tax=Pempheris klunzingeri TaxID=3127111 RepID=UPI003980E073